MFQLFSFFADPTPVVVRDEAAAYEFVHQVATQCKRLRLEARTPAAMQTLSIEQRELVDKLAQLPVALTVLDAATLDGRKIWADMRLDTRALFECTLPFVALNLNNATDRLRPAVHLTLERSWRGSEVDPPGYSPSALFAYDADVSRALDLDDAGLRTGAATWLGLSSAQALFSATTPIVDAQRALGEATAWLDLAADLAPSPSERSRLFVTSANLALQAAGLFADGYAVTREQLAHDSPLRASQLAVLKGVVSARKGWKIAETMSDSELLSDAVDVYATLLWRASMHEANFVLAGDDIEARDLVPTVAELERITELLIDRDSGMYWGLRALEPRVAALTSYSVPVDQMVMQLILDAAPHARASAKPICTQLALGKEIELGGVRSSTWFLATETLGCTFD